VIENFYTGERIYVTLLENKYKGVKFRIVSYGTHPCAYVDLPEGHKYVDMEPDNIPVNCHGGLTYKKGNTIGWDYGHFGDYFGGNFTLFSVAKRWTTLEIYTEVKNVIDQVLCGQ